VAWVGHNTRYSRFSLTRASALVNRQWALAWCLLRSLSRAATSSVKDCRSGIWRSRHRDDSTPSSDSAISSQLRFWGVVPLEPFDEAAGFSGGKGLVE
jgi:hypothetical protein